MGDQTDSARCPICRASVLVEARDTHGDQIHCDNCKNAFRVVRREGAVRLVIADAGPLRDEMRAIQQRIAGLEGDLRTARASLGIGANGFGLGVLYVVVKVALEEQPLTTALIGTAAAIALVTGILLELANFCFLAKRQAMSRLSVEIAEAQQQARHLRQTIREATRT